MSMSKNTANELPEFDAPQEPRFKVIANIKSAYTVDI